MKLIFIYNAEKGFLNKSLDFAHKLLSPSTYQCELCSITHHQLGERNAWKDFREMSGIDMVFLYKNEITTNYNCPVILFEDENNAKKILFDKNEISRYKAAEDLIAAIKKKLDLEQGK